MSLASLLITSLQDIQSTRYTELASGVIVFFDHMLTIDDEIELIWGNRWTAGKIVFLINRYYTLISVMINYYGLFSPHITDSFCQSYIQWQGWTGLIACFLAEVILQMRLYALYFLNKKILLLMATAFILSMAAAGTIMGLALSKIQTTSHLLDWVACVPLPETIPRYFYAFWIPILVFESFLCGLALYRVAIAGGAVLESGRQLVRVMVRDSVFYFLVMFATYLTNLLVWTAGRVSLMEIPIGFTVTLSCVLTNRLVLNVHRTRVDHTIHTVADGEESPHNERREIIQITENELMELRTLKSEIHCGEDGFIVL